MAFHGTFVELTAENPIRILLGEDNSDLVTTSTNQRNLVLSGAVELHLGFAQEKKIEEVTITFSGSVKTCALFVHPGIIVII